MKLTFVDTSGWIALVNISDSFHQKATKVYQARYAEGSRFVTHQGIMLEVGNGLSSIRLRPMAIGLKNKLEKSTRYEQISIDEKLYEAGWSLYTERLDKDWGIVDCISFVLMKEFDISEALTADKHFEQAGFIKLL
ncbi:MAG: type II toxin-antitoxin system VapC family toxin [Acidobacteria bacterium]|nr:type II toxin-antitoxin system VapC family toxin [Acidobacteriota bacterium]